MLKAIPKNSDGAIAPSEFLYSITEFMQVSSAARKPNKIFFFSADFLDNLGSFLGNINISPRKRALLKEICRKRDIFSKKLLTKAKFRCIIICRLKSALLSASKERRRGTASL